MAKGRKGMQVVKQKNGVDCGLAALAMLIDEPYGDVSAACLSRYGCRTPGGDGLAMYHLEELAEMFGSRLKRRYISKGYLIGQTGILGMNGGSMGSTGHWVILKDGDTVIDPDDGKVWSLEDYTKRHKCRTATMLVVQH